ncbi:hypothetical protein LOAG_00622 [Loa loa]|uniref:Uncharacterized protein n=1 Tax=Loa loa TaxID=7209 RepID=A0A1S0UAQ8_LOALO|nr:hypothetical protein LOAG_00622 [Loa loa]EFO27860.2 hypothetical protein LOAG_00622 [Loa loa]
MTRPFRNGKVNGWGGALHTWVWDGGYTEWSQLPGSPIRERFQEIGTGAHQNSARRVQLIIGISIDLTNF